MSRPDHSRTPVLQRAHRLLPPFLRKRPRIDPRRPQSDIQGLVLHGYKIMDAACFLLLRIEEPSKARRWLREILPEVTTSSDKSSEQRSAWKTSLNLALTWSGLKALGLPQAALDTFPTEFQEGMPARADILGDSDESAPDKWDFGGSSGPAQQGELHLLLMLYGTTPKEVSSLVAEHRRRLEEGGLRELGSQQAARMRNAEGGIVEHFGFRDGLSQPQIQGFREGKHEAPDHTDAIKPGEFLLGYENEYAETPDSPSVPATLDVKGTLSPRADRPDWKEFGRDGSFVVVRKLQQNVEDFQRFLEAHKELAVGDTDERKKQWLAAKLMGRWPSGEPLRPGEDAPPTHARSEKHWIDNSFGFNEKDPDGYGCPVASHIRRANPRDSLPPSAELSLQVSRRHRILRRGITYSDDTGKGMLFIAINANIARQFEFLQQTWLNNGKFGGRYDERDPLTTHGAGRLTLPSQPVRRCVEGIARFVTMKGGGYFFLPSLRALEFLAHLEPKQAVS
ncbi:MAG: Dyp-type peroxidase [Hyalangium sp.]|uniref:Dyp-type peroxidase n=1 Tax=Hyalangium sp. TaxID=2028555 RepID=UPI00389B1B9C